MRLIDADKLKAEGYMLHRYKTDFHTSVYENISLDDVATIEAEPVRCGHWIASTDDNWMCSECGAGNIYAYSWDITGYKLQDRYCPFCGAKMEGAE